MTIRPHLRPTIVLATLAAVAAPAGAAERLMATVPTADFNITTSNVVRVVPFAAAEPITGVGFTGDWTAVIADEEDGLYPWSLDLEITVQAPGGAVLCWPVVGGDRTIADFPLQDATNGFAGVGGTGDFTWTFGNSAPQAPFTMGLRNVQLHLMANAADVVDVRHATTEGGPLWNRPFYIAGVSGLGPVRYHVIEFEVPAAGRYRFVSVVDNGENNFTFLYQGAFDPGDPGMSGDTGQLANLLDYGLGNGSAPNGTPAGTSLIDALLLENTRYFYVTSQWSSLTDPEPFTTTITGPALIDDTPDATCSADLTGPTPGEPDGNVDALDFLLLIAQWSSPCAGTCEADITGPTPGVPDGNVDALDFLVLIAQWGCP